MNGKPTMGKTNTRFDNLMDFIDKDLKQIEKFENLTDYSSLTEQEKKDYTKWLSDKKRDNMRKGKFKGALRR